MKAIKKEVVWVGMSKEEAVLMLADLRNKSSKSAAGSFPIFWDSWEKCYSDYRIRRGASTGRAYDILEAALAGALK